MDAFYVREQCRSAGIIDTPQKAKLERIEKSGGDEQHNSELLKFLSTQGSRSFTVFGGIIREMGRGNQVFDEILPVLDPAVTSEPGKVQITSASTVFSATPFQKFNLIR